MSVQCVDANLSFAISSFRIGRAVYQYRRQRRGWGWCLHSAVRVRSAGVATVILELPCAYHVRQFIRISSKFPAVFKHAATRRCANWNQSCPWVGLTRGLGWVGSGMGRKFVFLVGWVGSWFHKFTWQWVGLGQIFGGLGWVGSMKIDPRTTLIGRAWPPENMQEGSEYVLTHSP